MSHGADEAINPIEGGRESNWSIRPVVCFLQNRLTRLQSFSIGGEIKKTWVVFYRWVIVRCDQIKGKVSGYVRATLGA